MAEPAPEPQTGASASGLTREELDELLGLGDQSAVAPPPRPFFATALGILALLFLVVALAAAVAAGILAIAWRRGMHGLALYQQPYVQLLRLGKWFGTLRVTPSHTPFEISEQLERQVPRTAPAIRELTTAYVEGTYGVAPPQTNPWPTWLATRRDVIRGLWRRRLRRWFGEDLNAATAPRSRPELLRQWGASRSGRPRLER